MSSSNSRTCSDGDVAVLAEITSISNNYYTSQINVTVKSTFTGSVLTITCFQDNGKIEEQVESYLITIENSAGSTSICKDSIGNASLSEQQFDETGMQITMVVLPYDILFDKVSNTDLPSYILKVTQLLPRAHAQRGKVIGFVVVVVHKKNCQILTSTHLSEFLALPLCQWWKKLANFRFKSPHKGHEWYKSCIFSAPPIDHT